MVRAVALLFALAPLSLCAQAAGGGGYAALVAGIKAMGDAANDAGRDSACLVVKRSLAAVLSSDTAFTASFTGVPMSHVDAPDGAFRLFTWNLRYQDGSFRYEGFLLLRDHKKLKLMELRDMTGSIAKPATAQLSPENWYGAIYYEVVPVKRGAKTLYTLLGWKGYSAAETRKVIEVLDLGTAMPRFGAPLFIDGRQRLQRVVFAFTAQSAMQLKWMPERKAIVADHLSATRPEFAGQPAFMAPDLSFDGYSWQKDHWQLNRDIDLRGGSNKPYNAPPKEQR